ncbi:MAG: hypothetical protein U1E28_09490 [Beijerinckiaceae bacterium]
MSTLFMATISVPRVTIRAISGATNLPFESGTSPVTGSGGPETTGARCDTSAICCAAAPEGAPVAATTTVNRRLAKRLALRAITRIRLRIGARIAAKNNRICGDPPRLLAPKTTPYSLFSGHGEKNLNRAVNIREFALPNKSGRNGFAQENGSAGLAAPRP